MKLHLFSYECKNCHGRFKSPQLLGNAYGEFLMRDSRGRIVYLNSFKDSFFDEVAKFFKNIVSNDQVNNTKLFQEVLSVVCDSGSEGHPYRIGQKPACPSCGEINIGHWGPTNPPEIVEVNVPDATHAEWNRLTEVEKQERIKKAVEWGSANN